MAARKPKGPPPGKWQYAVGRPPHQLTAFERADKRMAVYSRVWDGRRYHSKRHLCDTIRDAAGQILPELEIEAQQAAVRRQVALTAGLDVDEVQVGPLTLGAGFRRLLNESEGKYAGDSQHKREVARAARVIRDILGADLRWSQVRHAHYRKLWRELARVHLREGRYGLRQVEVICGVLQTAARWLQQETLIEPGEGEPAAGWKRTLRVEWAELTQTPAREPQRPRYTVEESRRLWAALPQADPRLWLGMEIGAELRLGQVPRSRRSDILPSPDGAEPLGAVRVHGKGKKHGATVWLTDEQRAVLHRVLADGYLADLEAAYQAGQLADYYLLPAGKLHVLRKSNHKPVLGADGQPQRRARVERGQAPIGMTGLQKQWRELEGLAGIAHVDGRSWYGMRRLQADLAEDVEGDARVLNRLGAWKHTSTRELYQEAGRPDIALKAAETRRKIRPRRDLGGAAGGPDA